MAAFLATNLIKGTGLNLQPNPEVLHLPNVVHPLAITLPDFTYTYPSSIK
jgi:hypothetical protein